jgi:hypothetical protein
MPASFELEFPGAIRHLMSRGDCREAICLKIEEASLAVATFSIMQVTES